VPPENASSPGGCRREGSGGYIRETQQRLHGEAAASRLGEAFSGIMSAMSFNRGPVLQRERTPRRINHATILD
jgi:hypothetical protein